MEVRNKYQQKLVPLDEGERRRREKRLTEGCTTLMYACSQGLTSRIVNELRNKPSSVLRRDRSNKSALHYCSGQKDLVAAASVAVAAPDLMESADVDGFTPLHLAVIQGNISLVNLLLANKADVNALDNEGHSVVHWATVCGEVEALRAVLQAGANVSIPDLNGGSPLHYAAQMCGANYDGKTDKASNKLAIEILNILLSHRGSSVTVEDKDGRQPLLWAASAGSSKSIIALVKGGAHVESADKDGLTALHCAASRGHTECIDTLINLCGAQTDLIDSNGCTALHYAVTLGHADATSLLLDLSADPNRQDRKGRTPAHCACSKGQLETVKILHARKGNLWLRNVRGDLPLHEAAASGRRELVQWLLETKRNKVNVTSNDGKTILHIAASNDNTDMCKVLLDLGADVNSVYRTSRNVVMTPLDCALQRGYRSSAKFIQMHGGLPASKMRLSARRPVKLPELDQVKPLKFYEKEEVTDLNNSQKFVVYIKKSDSESDEDGGQRSRGKLRVQRARRRTSSCSDSIVIQREDSFGDMSRCKSNMELNRHCKKSKYRSSSSSSESSTDDCCHHIKRKHRCYKKYSPKKCKSKNRQKSVEDFQEGKRSIKKKRKKEKSCKRGDKSNSGGSDGGSPHDSKKEKLEAAEGPNKPIDYDEFMQEQQEQAAAAAEEKKAKAESSEKDMSSKAPARPGSATARPKSARPPSAQQPKAEAPVVEPPKTPEEKGKANGFSEEDDAVIAEIVTMAQIHMDSRPPTKLDADEDIATDATYTVDGMENFDSLEPASDVNEPAIADEKPPEGVMRSNESPKKVSFQEDDIQQEEQEKLEAQEKEETTEDTEQGEGKVSLEKKMEHGMSKVSAVLELSKPVDMMKREQSGTPALTPPKCESPNSSFTVLDDDDELHPGEDYQESPEDTTHSDSNQTIKSFHLLDSTEMPDLAPGDFSAADFAVPAPPTQSGEKSSRKKKLKKRNKSKSKDGDTDDDRKLEKQASRDQDSGFEPSPRTVKSKIPSPRSTHTAILPRKSVFTTLDSTDAPNPPPVRARSSRLGRKPGDQYAVNMTSVTQSIQRNIRRYYMERKIFQHLLELKSLQIRSNKAHEAVVVKRAVEDYHKSTHALEYEVGTALRKYPYREYTFKNFELFLYETLKGLQKNGTFNFQNLSEVYREAERRLSPDISRYENALHCTTKTHRCLHAAHAYTGIPCAAYIPMINHHTIPKLGFGSYKSTSGLGSFYLPKILSTNTANSKHGNKVALELSHGNSKQLISLPSDKLDKNKRYYVTFTSVKDQAGGGGAAAAGGTTGAAAGRVGSGGGANSTANNSNNNNNNKNQTTINLQQQHQQQQPQPTSLPPAIKDDSKEGAVSGGGGGVVDKKNI